MQPENARDIGKICWWYLAVVALRRCKILQGLFFTFCGYPASSCIWSYDLSA